MIKVIEIKQTCTACPSQWEGKTDDGQFIYVRSRWDWLTIGLGKSIDEAVCETPVVELNDHACGYLEYADLKELTKDKIEWPEVSQ